MPPTGADGDLSHALDSGGVLIDADQRVGRQLADGDDGSDRVYADLLHVTALAQQFIHGQAREPHPEPILA